MKDVVRVSIFVVLVLGCIYLFADMQSKWYEAATIKNCEQYLSIPEEHLDRIPDGCMPLYFDRKASI